MKFVRLLAGVALGFAALCAAAQTWPARPVRMVIPFPPGGTLDTLGRAVAQKLSEQLGHPFSWKTARAATA
jgi:tripartite-type tricarboxylate transporter receptor subunit TctC